MKPGIHPEYHAVQATCVCGNVLLTGSTRSVVKMDICSACHPFFTGTQRIIDTEGRVEKFKKRYTQAEALKKAKKAKQEEAKQQAAADQGQSQDQGQQQEQPEPQAAAAETTAEPEAAVAPEAIAAQVPTEQVTDTEPAAE